MGRAYHSGEMATQITTMNQMMYGRISSANHVIQKIDEFVNNKDLQGKAYDSLRERMLLHAGTHRGIKYGAEAFIRANNYVQQQFLSMVGGDYVNTDRLEESMRMLYNSVYQLDIQETNLPSNALLSMFYRNQINVIQKVIDDMEQFNASIRDVYNEALEYYRQVAIGLSQIEHDGWNATTKTFASVDMSWSANIDKQHFDQELAKYVKNGEITEEGFLFFEESMKKKYTDITLEELDLLSEITLNVSNNEDIKRLLSSGYCIPIKGEGIPFERDQYAISDTFVLALLIADNKLNNNAINNIYNKNFDWDRYDKSNLYFKGMLEFVTTYDVIKDPYNDRKSLISVNNSTQDNKNGYMISNAGVGVVKVYDYGHGELATKNVHDGVFNNQAAQAKFANIMSLIGLLPGAGTMMGAVSSGQTVGETIDLWLLDNKEMPNVYSGNSAILQSDLAGKFELKAIQSNGKYYFITSPETKEALNKYNSNLNDLKTIGIKKTAENEELINRLKVELDESKIEYTVGERNGRYVINLGTINMNDLMYRVDVVAGIDSVWTQCSNEVKASLRE